MVPPSDCWGLVLVSRLVHVSGKVTGCCTQLGELTSGGLDSVVAEVEALSIAGGCSNIAIRLAEWLMRGGRQLMRK